MKANEAPEKLYLFEDPISGTPDYRWLSKRSDDNDIEYTRTDAFIEKALKWYCLDCECNDNCNALHNCFFKSEFKRYLEGADNALPPKFKDALNPDGSTSDNYRYRHFIDVMKDKFIEKAVNYLNCNLSGVVAIKDGNITQGLLRTKSEFIEDFKKFMKGE